MASLSEEIKLESDVKSWSEPPVDAVEFIERVIGSVDTPVCFRLIRSDGEDAIKLYGTLDEKWDEISTHNSDGFGVFLVVNEGGHADGEITAIRALFVDADGKQQPTAWHSPPDIITQRDATHWHAYFIVECPVEDGPSVQRQLADFYGTDPKVRNLSRVMRLPGTRYWKDGKEGSPYRTTVLRPEFDRDMVREVAPSLSKFTAALPLVPVKVAPRTAGPNVVLNSKNSLRRGRHHVDVIGREADQFASEHGGRDNAAFVILTRLMIDWAIERETAVDIVLKDFNDRLSDPLPAEQISEKIANNVLSFAENEIGCDADGPEVIFAKGVERFKPARPVDLSGTPLSFAELANRHVGPVEELIPGLLEKGITTILSAPGGTHKSRLAVQWGLSLAGGKPIFGKPVQQCSFVYLSYEDHPDEVARRAKSMRKRLELSDEALGKATYFDMTSGAEHLAVVAETGVIQLTPFFHQLHKKLRQMPGHKIVVADSTYNILQFQGQAKINEGAVKASLECLNRLCKETDSTLLILWHPSQAGQDRGDASGWSVAWHNTPRARLSLTAKKDDAFELKVEKRNNGPKGDPLTLYWADGVLLPRDHLEAAERSSMLDEAVIAFALHAAEIGMPLTRQRKLSRMQLNEVASRSGASPSDADVKDALWRAVSAGRLRYQSGLGKLKAGFLPVEPALG